MTIIATMPGQQRPWMEALETQLDALGLINLFLTQAPAPIRDLKSWNVDKRLIESSMPFAWNKETTAAVLAASKSIPLDTALNKWNLATSCVWWHFEEPLPFPTVQDASLGIRALVFGWIPIEGLGYRDRAFGLPVCSWVDEPGQGLGRSSIIVNKFEFRANGARSRVTPSQTFEWERDLSLGEMLERTRIFHRLRYGPKGPDAQAPQVGEDVFMAATEGVARFVLAGLAWLSQKVLIETAGHVERHRRKDFERRTKQTLDGVRVVSLRQTASTGEVETCPCEGFDHASGAACPCECHHKREYSCRFMVQGDGFGFWRNQPCGPKQIDRRLTWIAPFMKGPADKPFRPARKKVYIVNR